MLALALAPLLFAAAVVVGAVVVVVVVGVVDVAAAGEMVGATGIVSLPVATESGVGKTVSLGGPAVALIPVTVERDCASVGDLSGSRGGRESREAASETLEAALSLDVVCGFIGERKDGVKGGIADCAACRASPVALTGA